jgi:RimJ/RimL family protein N-acetyltransferase
MSFAADLLSTAVHPKVAEQPSHPPRDGLWAFTYRWVPIRSLTERHRPNVLAHLLALPERDRYLRFGYAASDAQLARYVDLIDFSSDEVFGIFNRRLGLVAMAHLAVLPGTGNTPAEAELGASVRLKARGRGYGARLFDHAMLHARNRHIGVLLIHALSENTAMLHIARNAGATLERDGGESLARLRLPPGNLLSHMDELVEGHAAELDYHLKVHAQRVDGFLEAIGEVKSRLTCGGRPAQAAVPLPLNPGFGDQRQRTYG